MKKYIVYAHYTLGNEYPFYIGKGSYKRAFSKTKRSAEWKDVVNQHGYEVKILYEYISEEDAFKKEEELIAEYGRQCISPDGKLVNKLSGKNGHSGAIRSDEFKRKVSEALKKRWANGEFEAVDFKYTTASEGAKKRWENAEYRKNQQSARKSSKKVIENCKKMREKKNTTTNR